MRLLTLVVALAISVSAQTKKQASYPLSPLFARIAYTMADELIDLGLASTKPMIEDDYTTSPYEMRLKAIEKELDRIYEFDLRTKGDYKLHEMLTTDLSLIAAHKRKRDEERERHMESIRAGKPIPYSPNYEDGVPYIECVSSIRLTVSRRAWAGNGNCVLPTQ
jgi:hypothetical protein